MENRVQRPGKAGQKHCQQDLPLLVERWLSYKELLGGPMKHYVSIPVFTSEYITNSYYVFQCVNICSIFCTLEAFIYTSVTVQGSSWQSFLMLIYVALNREWISLGTGTGLSVSFKKWDPEWWLVSTWGPWAGCKWCTRFCWSKGSFQRGWGHRQSRTWVRSHHLMNT